MQQKLWITFCFCVVGFTVGCKQNGASSPTLSRVSNIHPEIKVVDGIENVYVGDMNVTKFSDTRQISGIMPSPSDRYLLVCHQEDPSWSWKTSIYDLADDVCNATIEIGWKSTFEWAADDLLFQTEGLGTNWLRFVVWDANGNKVTGGSVSGIELCALGDYFLIMPSIQASGEPMAVVDIHNGMVLAHTRPSDFEFAKGYRWLDQETIRFFYLSSDDTDKHVDVVLNRETAVPLASLIEA